MWRRLLLFSAAASMAYAQGALSGPSLGWFFDPHAQALRRIWGIPGSAIAGESLDLGFPVAKASFSPAQDYAFVTSGDGSVSLILVGQPGVVAQPVTVLPAGPDQIAVSPSGNAAVFIYGASVKILTGLPGSLDRLEEIDGSALPGAPAALAVSDDGAVLLASIPDNAQTSASGGVFVFNRGDKGPRLIAPRMTSDLSFFAASHDALLTDESGNSVTLLADAGGNATAKWVFIDERLPAPSRAKPSVDGQRIVIGSVQNSLIAVLDKDGGNAVFMPCVCSPDRIAPFNNVDYQLTDPGAGLLWILDLSQDPRLLFVPTADVTGASQ